MSINYAKLFGEALLASRENEFNQAVSLFTQCLLSPVHGEKSKLFLETLCKKDVSAEDVPFIRSMAGKGHAMAQYNLGVCYEYGYVVEVDKTEAVRYYTLAAKKEYAPAQNTLGVCYEQGRGVGVDKTKAVDYYTLAANQGHACAQYNLRLLVRDISKGAGAGVGVGAGAGACTHDGSSYVVSGAMRSYYITMNRRLQFSPGKKS